MSIRFFLICATGVTGLVAAAAASPVKQGADTLEQALALSEKKTAACLRNSDKPHVYLRPTSIDTVVEVYSNGALERAFPGKLVVTEAIASDFVIRWAPAAGLTVTGNGKSSGRASRIKTCVERGLLFPGPDP